MNGARTMHPAAGALLGIVAGFASAFLGIGGGLIIVPALTALFGVPIKKAIGTSLAAIILVAAVGVATEAWVKGENIHWGTAAVLAAGALAGSWFGSRLVAAIPASPLRWLLVLLLIVASARLSGLLSSGTAAPPFETWTTAAGAVSTVCLGAVAGVASVMFGIGGGIVVVPGLTLLFGEFAFHGARATSLAMIIPTSAFGALLHRRLRNIDTRLAAAIIPASLAGAIAGVVVVNRIPDEPLRWTFAAFLLFAAWRLARIRIPN